MLPPFYSKDGSAPEPTANLRYRQVVVPDNFGLSQKTIRILEQQWVNPSTGESMWKPVETVDQLS